jgi:hypothetical protein
MELRIGRRSARHRLVGAQVTSAALGTLRTEKVSACSPRSSERAKHTLAIFVSAASRRAETNCGSVGVVAHGPMHFPNGEPRREDKKMLKEFVQMHVAQLNHCNGVQTSCFVQIFGKFECSMAKFVATSE